MNVKEALHSLLLGERKKQYLLGTYTNWNKDKGIKYALYCFRYARAIKLLYTPMLPPQLWVKSLKLSINGLICCFYHVTFPKKKKIKKIQKTKCHCMIFFILGVIIKMLHFQKYIHLLALSILRTWKFLDIYLKKVHKKKALYINKAAWLFIFESFKCQQN